MAGMADGSERVLCFNKRLQQQLQAKDRSCCYRLNWTQDAKSVFWVFKLNEHDQNEVLPKRILS